MANEIKFFGLNETLFFLKNYEKELYDALRKDLVTAALPLAMEVGKYFPDNPFNPNGGSSRNNWFESGERRGDSRLPPYDGNRAAQSVRPVAGGTGLGRRGSIILRIEQKDAGGKVYDMAGQRGGKNAQGVRFIAGLDKYTATQSRGGGNPRSRSLFKGVRDNQEMIEQNVLDVVKKIDGATTRRINAGSVGVS